MKAKRILATIVSLVVSCVWVSAQAMQAPIDGPGLTVLHQKWRVELRNPSLERDPIQEMKDRDAIEQRRKDAELMNEQLARQGMPTQPIPVRPMTRGTGSNDPSASYIYEAKVRNIGSKGTSKIIWEYIFSDPLTSQEMGRRRFESKARIAPGRTANISERSAISPTGTIDAARPGKRSSNKYSEKIVIQSVEYSDGSVWKPA